MCNYMLFFIDLRCSCYSFIEIIAYQVIVLVDQSLGVQIEGVGTGELNGF